MGNRDTAGADIGEFELKDVQKNNHTPERVESSRISEAAVGLLVERRETCGSELAQTFRERCCDAPPLRVCIAGAGREYLVLAAGI